MTNNSNEASNAAEDNKLVAERRAKLSELRTQGKVFPNDFRRDSLAAELQAELGEHDKPSLEALNRQASVAGRVMNKRGPFIVLQDVSGQIQLYLDKKSLLESMAQAIKGWDIVDIVGA